MNIIFDLGGVTLTWNPDLFVSHTIKDNKTKEIVCNTILNNPLWTEMDKGTIPHQDAVKRAVENSGLPHKTVVNLVNSISEVLNPIPKTLEIIKELKVNNHRLYVLSNMPLNAADELESKYHFWHLFDGIIFSSRVKMVKPDSEIFQHIIEKYNMDVSKTIFIDDTLKNIIAAKDLGIKALHFKTPEQCRIELKKLSCL